MKRTISIVIALFVLLIATPFGTAATASGFAGGDGSEENPYLIANAQQLMLFSETVKNEIKEAGHYVEVRISAKLVADITLNEDLLSKITKTEEGYTISNPESLNVWYPLGVTVGDTNYYTGVFDGNGHYISGLLATSDLSYGYYTNRIDFIGLFGRTVNATIKNLEIKDSFIYGKNDAAGAFVGHGMYTSVENCILSDSIVDQQFTDNCGDAMYMRATGLFFGCMKSACSVKNCTNYSDIDATETISGIVGRVEDNCVITGCSNYGNITSAGGASGICLSDGGGSSRITECNNYGNIEGASAAGICDGHSNAIVERCANFGNIKGKNSAGGVIGSGHGHKLGDIQGFASDCFNVGNVTGGERVGGFAGVFQNPIINCYSIGRVQGDAYKSGVVHSVGAFVGYSTQYELMENCYYLAYNTMAGEASVSLGVGNMMSDLENAVTPLNEYVLKVPDVFVGFDFDNVWIMADYPVFRYNTDIKEPSDDADYDVNGDGSVNVFDCMIIKSIYFGSSNVSDDVVARSDVNGDGKVNVFDYVIVKQAYFAG